MQNYEDVQHAAAILRATLGMQNIPCVAPLGIVLGTGLSDLADNLADRRVIPYSAIPAFPLASVEGHAGAFVWGRIAAQGDDGKNSDCLVLFQQGRCHLYEGRSPAEVCMGVRVMAALGVKTLIITNTAGALNPNFDVGDIMCITDIINHTGVSSLTGANCDAWGQRFPDMSAPLDANLRALALETSTLLGIRLERGVYIGVHGPEMETPAETRMYRQWGADAVGMSTVLEIIAARHLGMAVLGLSCLANKNLPDCMVPAPLDEILAVAKKTGKKLAQLIRTLVTKL